MVRLNELKKFAERLGPDSKDLKSVENCYITRRQLSSRMWKENQLTTRKVSIIDFISIKKQS